MLYTVNRLGSIFIQHAFGTIVLKCDQSRRDGKGAKMTVKLDGVWMLHSEPDI